MVWCLSRRHLVTINPSCSSQFEETSGGRGFQEGMGTLLHLKPGSATNQEAGASFRCPGALQVYAASASLCTPASFFSSASSALSVNMDAQDLVSIFRVWCLQCTDGVRPYSWRMGDRIRSIPWVDDFPVQSTEASKAGSHAPFRGADFEEECGQVFPGTGGAGRKGGHLWCSLVRSRKTLSKC